MERSKNFWLFIKISFSVFWLNLLLKIIFFSGPATIPIGINKLISLNFLLNTPGKIAMLLIVLSLLLLYLLEKKMIFTTSVMTAVSILLISHHESTGVFLRATSYTTVIGAQALAYIIKYYKRDFDLEKFRIQFPVQIIAATYMLAGLSKLMTSGVEWIDTGKYFSLQILKNQHYFYFDTGNIEFAAEAWRKANWFTQNTEVVKLLLASSLVLELFCFAALIGRKVKMTYGVLLLGMHIGIYYVMGILIGGVAFNMAIFFLNPLYYIFTGLKLLLNKPVLGWKS